MSEELLGRGSPGELTRARERIRAIELQRFEARDAQVCVHDATLRRAEHIARLLLVNTTLLTDVGELAPQLEQRQWQSVLMILREDGPVPAGDAAVGARVAQYMTFDAANPNSIFNCINRARENGRGIRENISAEMWECLNATYNELPNAVANARAFGPSGFFRYVKQRAAIMAGLADATLSRDDGWRFFVLGRSIERVATGQYL